MGFMIGTKKQINEGPLHKNWGPTLSIFGLLFSLELLINARTLMSYGYSYAHQSYLQVITKVQLRQSLSRFRCSNHRLEVECDRHAKPESIPRRDRVCRLCSLGAIEDEDQLLVCSAHHDIRCKFGQQLGEQLTPCSLLPELN
jgi:hypothetical protein